MDQIARIFSGFSVVSLLDVLAVTGVIFWFLQVVRGTRAIQLIRGVALLLIIAYLAGTYLRLNTLNWLIRTSIPALVISVPVIFQPELRRALEQLGRTSDIINRPFVSSAPTGMHKTISEVVNTAVELARVKWGAIIVIERDTGLRDYAAGGVELDAVLSGPILLSIFMPSSPLHDGAIIVRGNRVVAAGCVLPLSENVSASSEYGTRHRAALGISEQTDAVSVVVSEETGIISLTHSGRIVRPLDAEKLTRILVALFRVQRREG